MTFEARKYTKQLGNFFFKSSYFKNILYYIVKQNDTH